MKTRPQCLVVVLTLLALPTLNSPLSTVFAQGTAFTYQGRLIDNGGPASGIYDLQFAIYGAATNGVLFGVVTNSATAVSNGLFTVNLDFGLSVFSGGARWLQMGVRPDGSPAAFTLLQPRQPITSAPYAITALSAGSVPPGSVTADQLAAGAVGTAQLANPYQSGSVSLEGFPPIANFGSYQTTWTVTFPTPFSTLPVLTVSLESPLNSAQRITPILVAQKRTDGFDMIFTVPNLPVHVATSGNIGTAPMAMLNGSPAIIYENGGSSLYFAKSLDATGRRWPAGTSVGVNVNGNANFCFDVANGFPVVAYFEYSTRHLKFVRATDTNGATWGTPVTVQIAAVGGFAMAELREAIIGGRPAIAWQDTASTGTKIFYIRANDANGDTWPAAGIGVTDSPGGGISLAEINARPAISFAWNNGLVLMTNQQTAVRYIRANDAAGAGWPVNAVNIKTNGYATAFSSPQLLSVNSNPSVFFQSTLVGNPVHTEFARAMDVNGAAWGNSVTMMSFPPQTGWQAAAVINAQPAVVWYDVSRSAFRYSSSADNGASFNTVSACPNNFTSFPFLLDAGGLPAFSFANPDANELLYIRDTNLIPDTYINWIAVQP